MQQHPAPRGKKCQRSGEATTTMASMSDLLEKLNKRMDNLEMKDKQQSASMDSDGEDDGKVEDKSVE